MRLLGLMSGTSMDGVDAALVDIEGTDASGARTVLEASCLVPYSPERRARIREGVEGGDARTLCLLDADLGAWFGEVALRALAEAGVDPASVDAIGSHGHTIWHAPPRAGQRGSTLQLGDAATIAAVTGIPVVSDFRSADMAAGGHGAPLVPWPDRVLFAVPGRPRALQNLGGMGNVTWLPPREHDEEDPVAFDTGPGNALLDLAAERATGGRLSRDEDGRMAARGTPDPGLLDRLMAHPFFREEPPRSTGRELFGPGLVDGLAADLDLRPGEDPAGWSDLLATLTGLTARSIGDAYRRWVLPKGVDEVILTGGGARNPELVRSIRAELDPVPVRVGAEALGMDPDVREAAAFAVLAWAHLLGLPSNVPSATGAAGPRVLGSLTPAPGRRP